MYRGLPQLNNAPEQRKHDWDWASNAEREMYTNAMEQWKKDYPLAARVMNSCIGEPRV